MWEEPDHGGDPDHRQVFQISEVCRMMMMMMMMILISLSKRNGIIKLDDTSPTRSVGMILVYCGIYLCAGSLAPGHAILSQPLPPARTSESGREVFCPKKSCFGLPPPKQENNKII